MKIGLQNFQGIGAYTEIPIKPLTLFYGANSAGKSTVADAFEFLNGALSGNNLEWQKDLSRHARRNRKERPLTSNHIGEPEDVVFQVTTNLYVWHDICDFSKRRGYTNPDQFFEINNGLGSLLKIGDGGALEAPPVDFEYRIIFREENDYWRVQEALLSFNGTPFFKKHWEEEADVGPVQMLSFNLYHPAYQRLNDDQWKSGFPVIAKEMFDAKFAGLDDECGWISLPCRQEAEGYDSGNDFSDSPLDWMDVGGAIDWEYWESISPAARDLFNKVTEVLDFLIVVPARSVARACNIYTVPPIREIPPKDAIYPTSRSSRFGKEKDCWAQLAKDFRVSKLESENEPEADSSSWLNFLNEMLGSDDFLGTGYKVDADLSLTVDLKEIKRIFDLPKSKRQAELANLPAAVHPYLVYKPENFSVEICDVGVGISQVIPVLYGCFFAGMYGCVHIQQPELHLHPKLQAQLADVFIKCVNAEETIGEETQKLSREFLIESHSEHFLLRVLRRIRESHARKSTLLEMSAGVITNAKRIKDRHLTADQVSVVYVSKDEFGVTQLKPLRLNDDGEFIDRWPDGFFTERDRELFGDEDPFA